MGKLDRGIAGAAGLLDGPHEDLACVNELSDSELGWVAGLLEGEGSFSESYKRVRVQVYSTDEDVVRRIHALTGLGNVTGPYARRATNIAVRSQPKPIFCWVARVGSERLCEAVFPLMGERRQGQILKALSGTGVLDQLVGRLKEGLCRFQA